MIVDENYTTIAWYPKILPLLRFVSQAVNRWQWFGNDVLIFEKHGMFYSTYLSNEKKPGC